MKKNIFILMSVLFFVPAIYAVSAQRGLGQSIKTGYDIFSSLQGTQISETVPYLNTGDYAAVGTINNMPEVVRFNKNTNQIVSRIPLVPFWLENWGRVVSAIIEADPDEDNAIMIHLQTERGAPTTYAGISL